MASSVKNVVINVKANTKGVKQLQTEFQKLEKENKDLATQFKKTNKQLEKGMKKSQGDVGGMSSAMRNLGGVVAGAFAVHNIVQFGKAILDTRAEFQKLEAVLTNTLGSKSEAQRSMFQLQKFASDTPFAVVELTQAYVKLVNQGFKPTMDEMRKMGDLASSTGKDFDMLAEAIIDAQTGEFERLKEFGIRASKQGDQVKFTFKGVETQTKFTTGAIQEYILSLGNLEGVSGSMEAISKTLGGQISNMGDAWDTLLNTLGGQTEGVFSTTISLMAEMVEKTTAMAKSTEDLRKQTEILYGGDTKNSLQNIMDLRVKAGDEEEAIRHDLLDLMQQEIYRREDNIEKTREELESTSFYQTKKINLLKSVIEEQENELAVAIKVRRSIHDMTASTEALNEVNESEIDNIVNLQKKIKALTITRNEAKKGSIAFTNAVRDLALAQADLKERLNPTNKELEKQKQLFKDMEEQLKELKSIQAEELTLIDVSGDTGDVSNGDLYHGFVHNMTEDEWNEQVAQDIKNRETINDALLDSLENLADSSFEIYKNRLDAEFEYEQAILNSKLVAKTISQEQYEVEEKKLFQEQAERQKRLAIFEVNIAGAMASAQVWATHGAYPVVAGVLQAIVVGETLAQIAIIESQPKPKYADGGLIGGKRHSSGGTIIEAEQDEFIINRHDSMKHRKLIENINGGNTMEYINKTYVYPALQRQSLDNLRSNSLADNIANSIAMHQSLDDQRIVGMLGRMDKNSKKNTSTLVKALGNNRKDLRNV